MASKMTKEALEARRAYQRKWRKEHPEKIKEIQNRYWAKKALKAKEEAAAESL